MKFQFLKKCYFLQMSGSFIIKLCLISSSFFANFSIFFPLNLYLIFLLISFQSYFCSIILFVNCFTSFYKWFISNFQPLSFLNLFVRVGQLAQNSRKCIALDIEYCIHDYLKFIFSYSVFHQLMMILIKTSDISNEVRPMDVAKVWVERLFEEYFNQVF